MRCINYIHRRARNLIAKTQERIRYKRLEGKASLLYDAFMEGGVILLFLALIA